MSARFVIEVDSGGMVGWTLVDETGTEVDRRGGFGSVEECRASVESYRSSHPDLTDAEVVDTGTVPNI